MSFALTIEQFRGGTKTVTRRQGWKFLKKGDIVMGVEKGMGIKKGEKVKELHQIEILSIYPERIELISVEDVVSEGFPDGDQDAFIRLYCKANKVQPHSFCNRIEFKHLIWGAK